LAQQVARVGTFDWNIQTGVNTWTPELEAMYGLKPGAFAGSQQTWEGLVYPADRAEAVRQIENAMETGKFEADGASCGRTVRCAGSLEEPGSSWTMGANPYG
jgi:hypothetical protein